jgi:hypothetical protein
MKYARSRLRPVGLGLCCTFWLLLAVGARGHGYPILQSTQDVGKPGIDRTTPALQRMTSRQRAIAHEFRGLSSNKKRLLDDLVSISVASDESFGAAGTPTPSLAEFLTSQMCATDTTMVGTVTSAQSFPTEDGTFLFTEHQFLVADQFRVSPAARFVSGAITLVRPGGDMLVEGVHVRAHTLSSPPLVVGQKYLLFASYRPSLGVFGASGGNSAFLITGDALRTSRLRLSDADLTGGVNMATVLRVLRSVTCR